MHLELYLQPTSLLHLWCWMALSCLWCLQAVSLSLLFFLSSSLFLPLKRSEDRLVHNRSFKQESVFISRCADNLSVRISLPLLVLTFPLSLLSALLMADCMALLLLAYHNFTNDAEIAGLTSFTHFQYASSRSLLCFSFKTMLCGSVY